MDDIYQKIELQFSNDISDLDSKFHKEKEAVESIMKDKLIDYVLEVVENQENSFFENTYNNGYTLYLIVKKIDLNYVVKLLDENKIGYFLNNKEKWAAIESNDIDYEEESIEDEEATEEVPNELTEEQIEKADTSVRIGFSLIFGSIDVCAICLAYYCYTIRCYQYVLGIIAFLILQIPVYKYFFKFFKKKDNHL